MSVLSSITRNLCQRHRQSWADLNCLGQGELHRKQRGRGCHAACSDADKRPERMLFAARLRGTISDTILL